MNNVREKYLPLGTVCLLKNGKKRIMIIGYAMKSTDGKVYDYLGALYPEGIINFEQNLFFNHTDIEKISFIGLTDAEYLNFNKKLLEFMKNR